jgi:hypothetical protein
LAARSGLVPIPSGFPQKKIDEQLGIIEVDRLLGARVCVVGGREASGNRLVEGSIPIDGNHGIRRLIITGAPVGATIIHQLNSCTVALGAMHATSWPAWSDQICYGYTG